MEDVTVQDNRVSVANLWIVSKRFQNFDIKKKGSSIVFKSKKYHFDVIWDNVQNAKIVISKCLMDQVVGLCGLYNKQVEDDRTTPDGSLVKSNQDFGNSWSIGPADRCSPPACEEYYMREAITTCEYLL
ncbi:hemocytin [Caerostris extrusa]|uniref:Hemocytin n=1 Tax=Caerostris extrusa TaxID=172846 RepID=A0AAV4UVX0_CAEEX|nr:hemocytin [Caerostris extrusa]